MGKIFDYDNNFFAGISKVSDTIILNFLFFGEKNFKNFFHFYKFFATITFNFI